MLLENFVPAFLMSQSRDVKYFRTGWKELCNFVFHLLEGRFLSCLIFFSFPVFSLCVLWRYRVWNRL